MLGGAPGTPAAPLSRAVEPLGAANARANFGNTSCEFGGSIAGNTGVADVGRRPSSAPDLAYAN